MLMNSREKSTATQLKSSTFWLLFISLACNALWVQLVSGLYKAVCWQNFLDHADFCHFATAGIRVRNFISSDLFLSMVGSMASVFNAGSRIVWGVAADKSVAGILAGLLSQFILPLVGFDILFLIAGCFMAISLIITTCIHFTIAKPPQPVSRYLSDEE
ncbi:hypothetical protein COOONC_25030 [Cooperia oncophora]